MRLREKGAKKDAEPVSMGWDEGQAAIVAGTHVPVDDEARTDGKTDSDEVDYDQLTREQLDALAVERGVDISAAKNKADVIAALKTAN